MDFGLSTIAMYLLLGCLLCGPVAIFIIRPEAASWKRPAKLLLPIVIFFFTLAPIGMGECFRDQSLGCLVFKLFFLCLGTLFFTMYLGWFEYIFRRIHKQIAWPLKENLKYGIVSNAVLSISAFMTLVFILFSIFQHLAAFIL